MARIGIVLLAAGNSTRMGQPKQLLDFGGKPLIRHCAEAALASRCRPVIVVCGEREAEIRTALAGLPVECVANPEWAGGMGTSIHAGLTALAEHAVDGVVLTLGDLPLLTAGIFDGLIAAQEASGKPIVAAAYSGTVGVPVLFLKPHFGALLALAPNQGCKGVILGNASVALHIPCPEAEVDVDTPEEYRAALELRR